MIELKKEINDTLKACGFPENMKFVERRYLTRLFKVRLPIVITLILLIVCSGSSVAGEIDWQKIKTLQDMAFVEYVKNLDLKGQAALNFWKNIPVSKANQQVH